MVRFAPERTGKIPPAVSWTSCDAPLKVLPWRVTFVVSLASATVPLEMLVPFKLVRLEPEPENVPAIAVPLIFRLPVWAVPGVEFCSCT